MGISLTNKPDMAAIILAGGKSARMKMDKALLPISGVPMIEKIAHDLEPHFREIIICADFVSKYGFLPFRVIADEEPGTGPLMGILSGLRVSSCAINFVMACDIPEINIPFIEQMKEYANNYDIVVPQTGEALVEPLFAFYNRTVIPGIERLLTQGTRKVIELYGMYATKYVHMPDTGWLHNLNTSEEYEKYLERGSGVKKK